jgi:hypothetical protein
LNLALVLRVGTTLVFYVVIAILMAVNILPSYYQAILIVFGPILGFFSASFSYMFQNTRNITLLREQIYAEVSRIYSDLDLVLESELGDERTEKEMKEDDRRVHSELVDWMLTFVKSGINIDIYKYAISHPLLLGQIEESMYIHDIYRRVNILNSIITALYSKNALEDEPIETKEKAIRHIIDVIDIIEDFLIDGFLDLNLFMKMGIEGSSLIDTLDSREEKRRLEKGTEER